MPKLELLHQEVGVTPFTLGIFYRGFHQKWQLKFIGPLYFKNSVVEHKNYNVDWYGDWQNFLDIADCEIEKVKKDGLFSSKLLKAVQNIGEKLLKENNRVSGLDLKKLSNTELVEAMNKLYCLGNQISDLGSLAVIPDLRHAKLTNLLKEIIKEKIKMYNLKKPVNDYFSILIASPKRGSFYKEGLAIINLAKKIARNKELDLKIRKKSAVKICRLIKNNHPLIYQEIKKIEKQFSWLAFGHFGPTKSISQFVEDIQNLLRNQKVNQEFNALAGEEKGIKRLQKLFTEELKLNTEEKRLFQATRDFGYNKVYRYEKLLFTFFNLNKILSEIGRRIKWAFKDLLFTSPEEVNRLVLGKKSVSKREIKERRKYCVTFIKGRGIVHLTGKKAKEYLRQRIKKGKIKEDVSILHGTAAFLGIVSGVAKIVNTVGDLDKVNKGDILISIQTNPDLLPAMRKAAAIVTDIGGITSHAAIVARELRKPCIIGTKIASKVFKDGDFIEVDAHKGDVRILKRN